MLRARTNCSRGTGDFDLAVFLHHGRDLDSQPGRRGPDRPLAGSSREPVGFARIQESKPSHNGTFSRDRDRIEDGVIWHIAMKLINAIRIVNYSSFSVESDSWFSIF